MQQNRRCLTHRCFYFPTYVLRLDYAWHKYVFYRTEKQTLVDVFIVNANIAALLALYVFEYKNKRFRHIQLHANS